MVIAASRGGKVKTVTQIIAISLVILNIPGGIFVMGLALFVTVYSGMDYLVKNKKVLVGE
jgi:CDP-diacylglycerol--glycerol-3-phosphate 3-phosphatidyltransferase